MMAFIGNPFRVALINPASSQGSALSHATLGCQLMNAFGVRTLVTAVESPRAG
jgi:hypothetical protein